MGLQYSQFANTKLWNAIDKAIANLEKNRDLELTTDRRFVVGYLCKSLAKRNLTSKRKSSGSLRRRGKIK